MRRMMNDPERVHEVVQLGFHELRQALCIGGHKPDAILEAENPGALPRQLKRLVGEVDSGDECPSAREVDRIGPQATPDFEHAAILPARELSEGRNMRFDEVLSPLNLIEVRAAPYWSQ